MNTLIACFPSSILKGLRNVDEAFVDEMSIFVERGIPVALVDVDGLKMFYDGSIRAFEHDFKGATILYRGWMLNTDEYENVEKMVLARNGLMYTNSHQYQESHYIPHWINAFEANTAQTKVYPKPVSFEQAMDETPEWDGYFVKDFVKSYHGYRTAKSRNELGNIIQHLMENEEIQGGLVVREECMSLLRGTDEIRCWWTQNGWLITHHPQHPNVQKKQVPVAYLTHLGELLEELDVKFVSVDLYWDVELMAWRVIEIGDGQVSGVGDFEDLNRLIDIL